MDKDGQRMDDFKNHRQQINSSRHKLERNHAIQPKVQAVNEWPVDFDCKLSQKRYRLRLFNFVNPKMHSNTTRSVHNTQA